MKIRISGTPAELQIAVQAVAAVLPVVEVSAAYPNHDGTTGRVYLEIGPVQTTPIWDTDT